MQQIYLQTQIAQNRLERLQSEATTYNLVTKFIWRKRIAGILLIVADWLEPTLSASTLPASPLSTSTTSSPAQTHTFEPLHTYQT